MVAIKKLALPISIILFSVSSLINFNMPIIPISKKNATNNNYPSIQEIKSLQQEGDISLKGVIVSMDNNSVHMVDQDSGVGIKVNDLNLDNPNIKVKNIIAIKGYLNIDPITKVKSIANASLVQFISASNEIHPTSVTDISSYFTSDNVGNVIDLKNLRYWDYIKDNSYTFKDAYDYSFDFNVSSQSYIQEDTHFLNSIGTLKLNDKDLIKDDKYNIQIKSLLGLLNYDNTYQIELFEGSKIDINYRKAMEDALIIHEHKTNQCLSQFEIAQVFILNLPEAVLKDFKENNLPSIKPLRERYLAWAKHLGLDPWSISVTPTHAYAPTYDVGVTLLILLGVSISLMISFIYIKYRRKKHI